MSQRLGRVFIKLGGQLVESMPGAKLNPGGFKRDPVVGNSVHGYAESTVPAMVEFEISVDKNTKVLDLNNYKGSITFECDTGQTFVVRDAFNTEPGDITAGEGGKVPYKFAGAPADPVN